MHFSFFVHYKKMFSPKIILNKFWLQFSAMFLSFVSFRFIAIHSCRCIICNSLFLILIITYSQIVNVFLATGVRRLSALLEVNWKVICRTFYFVSLKALNLLEKISAFYTQKIADIFRTDEIRNTIYKNCEILVKAFFRTFDLENR